jgi:hypothetical protein
MTDLNQELIRKIQELPPQEREAFLKDVKKIESPENLVTNTELETTKVNYETKRELPKTGPLNEAEVTKATEIPVSGKFKTQMLSAQEAEKFKLSKLIAHLQGDEENKDYADMNEEVLNASKN